MLRLARPAFAGVLALLWAGVASATPVIFTFVSSTSAGGAFPTSQTVTPALPFSGTGDVDEALGTYTLTLPDHSITLDVSSDAVLDARLDLTGWGQTGTFAGGVGGGLTGTSASGSVACVVLGGIGSFVCPTVPTTVAVWPPTGPAGPFGAAGATIDLGTNTITVNSAFDTNGGQVQSVYTYSIVPEPGTMLLLGMGLIGLVASGRRQA